MKSSRNVGLCDEYPSGPTHVDMELGKGYPGTIEEGMVLCVEALAAPPGGSEAVKLEEQVVITADGPQPLTTYPLDLV